MNFGRAYATATLLPNGKVLIAGGSYQTDDDIVLPLPVELYDPDTNSFAVTTPSMNLGRAGAEATMLLSGRILLSGGNSTSAELYTP